MGSGSRGLVGGWEGAGSQRRLARSIALLASSTTEPNLMGDGYARVWPVLSGSDHITVSDELPRLTVAVAHRDSRSALELTPKPRPDLPPSPSFALIPLGFPPRIIIFFSLLLTILYLTGAISLPHSSSLSSSSSGHAGSHHGVTHSHLLTPHDYLNASLSEPAPFAFCPLYGPGDEVANRRGQVNLLKTRLHTGTGARVQKVVRKALSGAPLTISVLGASGQCTFFV